jgi:hypothetical protein
LVVHVARRATRLWIRYLLKTKKATAPIASSRAMTIAAITPPEGRPEEFASPVPAKADSAGTAEVSPPLTGPVVLPETGLWRVELDIAAVEAGVEIGGGDDDDDDSMISDEAGSTESERSVIIEVELSVLGVGMSPTFDACRSATTFVGTGVLVVRIEGPSW